MLARFVGTLDFCPTLHLWIREMLSKYSKHLFYLLPRILVVLFCVGPLAAQDSPDMATNRDVGTVRLTSNQPGLFDAS